MQGVRRKWLARWIVSFLIGVGTAVVASIIEVCIEFMAHYKFVAIRRRKKNKTKAVNLSIAFHTKPCSSAFFVLFLVVDGCDGSGLCAIFPLLVWVAINASLVFCGSLLVTYLEVGKFSKVSSSQNEFKYYFFCSRKPLAVGFRRSSAT